MFPLKLIFAFSLFWVSGCGSGKTPKEDNFIDIVCTTGMVGEMADVIGGEFVKVRVLMGAGIDPHLYRPTPSDVKHLQSADWIISSGLHLEGKMADLFHEMEKNKPVFALGDRLPQERLIVDGTIPDPHIWFDVELWGDASVLLAEWMAEQDPDHAETYRENSKKYLATLKELHQECLKELATIPEKGRVMVTSHDAFRYLGRAYQLEVHGVQGVSTEAEASVQHINELVDLLVDRKVKAVFVESTISERNIQALIEGCGSRGHSIIQGGELFSDAMGPPGTEAETYPGMIRTNIRTIVQALR